MTLHDNVVALRAFSDAIGNELANEPDQGRRSFQQFLLDSADEIEQLRIENAALRAIFRVNMIKAYPTMSHAEIDEAMKGIAP